MGAVELPEEGVIAEIGTEWFENVELSGIATCKIDTGAQANVIALSVVGKITVKPEFEITDTKLRAYNKTVIPCLGKLKLRARFRNIDRQLIFFVVPFEATTNLGLPSSVDSTDPDKTTVSEFECSAVRPQTQTNSEKVKRDESENSLFSDQIKKKYADVFDNSSLGCISGPPCDRATSPLLKIPCQW